MLRIRATVVDKIERSRLNGLSHSVGRFSHHATLNSLSKQSLDSLDLPPLLAARVLYRTDDKRPNGVTMTLWEIAKEL